MDFSLRYFSVGLAPRKAIFSFTFLTTTVKVSLKMINNSYVKNRIEHKFKIPAAELIKRMHILEGLSVLKISQTLGVSRDFIYTHAKRAGLKLRSHRDAALKKEGGKGEAHWAYGLRKENSKWAKMHSVRMKKKNPMKDPDVIKQITITRAKTYRDKLWPQEQEFKNILDAYKVSYLSQHPIGPYTIDFFIPDNKLCIEIDTTNKWGKERREHATKKDLFLYRQSYDVLRINKAWLKDEVLILTMLRAKKVLVS